MGEVPLAERLRMAAVHVQTPEERRAQRVSFIRGQTGLSDEKILAVLPELAPTPSDPVDRARQFVREVLAIWGQATTDAEVERVAAKVVAALPKANRRKARLPHGLIRRLISLQPAKSYSPATSAKT